jgi:hypothetical protein
MDILLYFLEERIKKKGEKEEEKSSKLPGKLTQKCAK